MLAKKGFLFDIIGIIRQRYINLAITKDENHMKSYIYTFLFIAFFLLSIQIKTLSANEQDNTWTEPVTGMEFVKVQGGCFQMGNDSGDHDEQPIHKVCVDSFWIGKYEVTQGQWNKIMEINPSKWQLGDDYPIENASLDDVLIFISKLNKQSKNTFKLPTEAQWEYAAKSGGKNEKYAGVSDPDKLALYCPNSGRKTHKVGTKAPNGLGIYDMSGNVCEWCEDMYDKNAYSKHAKNNPVINSGSSLSVVRGGGWFSSQGGIRTASRIGSAPDVLDSLLGFRLCRRPYQEQ